MVAQLTAKKVNSEKSYLFFVTYVLFNTCDLPFKNLCKPILHEKKSLLQEMVKRPPFPIPPVPFV